MTGAVVVKDGAGGNTARVDGSNRLHTFDVSRSEATQALIEGNGFTITTGSITLTSDSPSALLFIKNTDSDPWIITRIFSNTSVSQDGPGTYNLEIVGNAVTGSLIDSGADGAAANLNFGSPRELSSIIKIGSEGSSVNEGNPIIDSIVPTAGNRLLISGDPVAVPSGASAMIRVTPPAGNTSMDVQVGFVLYRANEG